MTAELLIPTKREKTSIKIVKDKIPEIVREGQSELTDDPHLQELVTTFAKKFKNRDQFIQAAELMNRFMLINMSDENNPPISQETAQHFYNKVLTDYEERRTTLPLPDYYVKFENPEERSGGRIYRRDEGHHMLWPHMGPATSLDSELLLLTTQFEEPATRFGGQLVLTLKGLEVARLKELETKNEPISIEATRPRELHLNTPAVLSA